MKGDEILRLIPQRPPVVMVDSLYAISDDGSETGLSISPDCIFCRDGFLTESGLIEHAAQSAAVIAGYGFYKKGDAPHIGLIAEIRNFSVSSLPKAGDDLHTSLKLMCTVGGMSLVEFEIRDGKASVASGQLKIYIRG